MDDNLPPFAVVMHLQGEAEAITNYYWDKELAEREASFYKKCAAHEQRKFTIEPHVIETAPQQNLGLKL